MPTPTDAFEIASKVLSLIDSGGLHLPYTVKRDIIANAIIKAVAEAYEACARIAETMPDWQGGSKAIAAAIRGRVKG